MIRIRPTKDADIDSITAIYSHHILHGTGTFETIAPSAQEMAARRSDVLSKGLPYLTLEDTSGVLGFAYCNWFKPRPAYRFSAEDSIYLLPTASGRGLGRLLLKELMAQAQQAGVRKLIAVIRDSENKGSIGVHQRCGFTHVGVLSACGWRFDQWLDVVLIECPLGMGKLSAPE